MCKRENKMLSRVVLFQTKVPLLCLFLVDPRFAQYFFPFTFFFTSVLFVLLLFLCFSLLSRLSFASRQLLLLLVHGLHKKCSQAEAQM
jgi:hypothetical protein